MTTNQLHSIGILMRLACSAIFLLAAINKLMHFGTYIDGFPLGSFLPKEIVIMLACGVIGLEVCIGVELISLDNKIEIARITCFVFGVFLIMSLLRVFPDFNRMFFQNGCNCFPEEVSFFNFANEIAGHIIRNTLFAAIAAINIFCVIRLKNSPDKEKKRASKASENTGVP